MSPPTPEQDWTSVDACTLPTADRPIRVAEFDAVFAESLVRIQHTTPASARMIFTGAPDVAARLQSLADRETECCTFFTFAITTDGGDAVTMDVTVPASRADVLAALVRRGERRTTAGSQELRKRSAG
jgi:hypothetical protein